MSTNEAAAEREKPAVLDGVPVTGEAVPQLAPFDRLMTGFLRQNKVPGAALAVTRGGNLIYARGLGYASVEQREPVQPRSLFRIASVSKPFTAATVMRLAEQHRLKLSDAAFRYVDIKPLPGRVVDPALARVTVIDLLQHRGGWDRDVTFDPMFQTVRFAADVGVPSPAGPRDVVRCMLSEHLSFSPGQRYAYSNFGYCVLGRVIERVSGKTYEQAVRNEVLDRIGIRSMRLARTQERAPGEVCYYASTTRAAAPSGLPFSPTTTAARSMRPTALSALRRWTRMADGWPRRRTW